MLRPNLYICPPPPPVGDPFLGYTNFGHFYAFIRSFWSYFSFSFFLGGNMFPISLKKLLVKRQKSLKNPFVLTLTEEFVHFFSFVSYFDIKIEV